MGDQEEAGQDRPTTEEDAKRFRELFRGRFSQEIAKLLIRDFGGIRQAADFVMTGSDEEVLRYLHENQQYMEEIRNDSENVTRNIETGIDTETRLFACGRNNICWWRIVPTRKKVSRCRTCFTRLEPISRDSEWGVNGVYICDCGNEFRGYGEMGVTVRSCFKCGYSSVPVYRIEPPSRCDLARKRAMTVTRRISKKVLTASKVHESSGSTVTTYLSQHDLRTECISVNIQLENVPE